MSLGKQARILTKGQVEAVLGYLAKTRYPDRNRVIFLLSVKAGLRAKEIASLTWEMASDGRRGLGTAIHLPDSASKGRSGRIIPLNSELIDALQALQNLVGLHESPFVVRTERSMRTSPRAVVNLFARWYDELGFQGCSSHSGRRTFITNAARKISIVGGSVRDVQILAGHSNMRTTQRYIEADAEAQKKIVELV
jgi:integrase